MNIPDTVSSYSKMCDKLMLARARTENNGGANDDLSNQLKRCQYYHNSELARNLDKAAVISLTQPAEAVSTEQ